MPYGSLPQNLCKEGLSLAYVRAVAAVAGCVTGHEYPDVGTDIVIRQEATFGVYSEASIAVQAKATATEEWRDRHLIFDLPVKNYDDLRRTDLLTPRILILMVLPKGRGKWLVERDEMTELRRYTYWLSLRGEPEAPGRRTRRVFIPRSQRFGVDSLCEILERVGDGYKI